MGPAANAAQIADALQAPTPRQRFAAAKRALGRSRDDPRSLRGARPAFVALAASPNRVMQWTAVRVLGNLAGTSTAAENARFLTMCRRFIARGELVLTNQVVAALAAAASRRPELRPAVIRMLLAVERAPHRTPECKRITMGKVLDALGDLGPGTRASDAVAAFVKRQARSARPSTRSRAKRVAALIKGPRTGRA